MIIPREFHDRWLAAGSSPVDWCEENYTVNSNIAEFTNTISNVLLFLLPALMIGSGVWRSYVKHISAAPYIVLFSMALVGLGSVYFHATLSLLGQFADELAIVWCGCLGNASLWPRQYTPSYLTSKHVYGLATLLSILLTVAWFVNPFIFCVWLFPMSGPAIYMVLVEMRSNKPSCRPARTALALFSVGVPLWMIDRFMCSSVQSMGLPGTHNIYHLIIALSTYLTMTTSAHWKAEELSHDVKVTLEYYPDKWYGLPYVRCTPKKV